MDTITAYAEQLKRLEESYHPWPPPQLPALPVTLTHRHSCTLANRKDIFPRPSTVPETLNSNLFIWERSTVIYSDNLMQSQNIDK